jgi:hypothetical protein
VADWPNEIGTALIERLGWCLVHSVWRGGVVALVAATVLRWLRQSSAQARYLAACVALVAMIVLHLVRLITAGSRRDADLGLRITMNQVALEHDSEPDRDSQSHRDADRRRKSLAAQIDEIAGRNGGRRPMRVMTVESVLPWLVGAWTIGVFGLSLRLLCGWLWIQWLVRRGSRPVKEQ